MKKVTLKILAVLVCAAAVMSVFSLISFSSQDEKEINPKTTYLSYYYGNIDHGALTTKVSTKATGVSNVTSIKIKMELQKLSDGVYSTVETWEQTFPGTSASFEESKLTNPFGTYRLKATVTACSGSASETKTFYINES